MINQREESVKIKNMKQPKIYLAIDNCFASKRWVHPDHWMPLIKELGVDYVEASADNECDPLYTTQGYIDKWIDAIKRNEKQLEMKVVNLYSGHGTYATTGLAHQDDSVKDHIQHQWLGNMIKNAGKLNAGLGFFCHAFDQDVLNNPSKYQQSKDDLVKRLGELAEFSSQNGVGSVGVEQMYTPHQVPWTIDGAKEIISAIVKTTGMPFYITLDAGHQSGQHKFQKPGEEELLQAVRLYKKSGNFNSTWLGPESCYKIIQESATSNEQENITIQKLIAQIEKYPFLFAKQIDADTYQWIRELACYSPIVHLQQTDGKTSAHWPFTEEFNQRGIITGRKVLNAISDSYKSMDQSLGFPGVEKIYLTIEVFSSTSDIPANIIERMKKTVDYWRKFVPKDGLTLDELLK